MGSAVISECGTYRYRLDREVQEGGKVFAYFGINPSTADATIDDATVRKWIGFTKRNGGRKFIVGNVFAIRATDVKQLAHAVDPLGPENPDYIEQIIQEADVLVPCWGNRTKVPAYNDGQSIHREFDRLLDLFQRVDKPVLTFGLTKNGDPKHPLMLGYDTPLITLKETTNDTD